MLNTIRKKIVLVVLISFSLLGTATLVSCGNTDVDPNAAAKSIPSTVNTIVIGSKIYTQSTRGINDGTDFTTQVSCSSNDLGMTYKSHYAEGGTTIELGGNQSTGTKTYKITSSYPSNEGEAYLTSYLYEVDKQTLKYSYTSVISESGNLTVSFENGKRVVKFSGVNAKVYEGLVSTPPSSKEISTTVLAGYIKCP